MMSIEGAISRTRRMLGRWLRTRTVRIGARTWRVPTWDRPVLDLSPAREPWLDGALAFALERRTGAFVDVGANAGQTLAKLLALDPDRPYVGFEPQPECAAALQRFFALNGLDRHAVVPVALAERPGLRRLSMRAAGRGDTTASIADGHRPASFYDAHAWISAETGDRALEAIGVGPVACLKADVEGAEHAVFEGCRATILRDRPYLVFEVLNAFLHVGNAPLPAALYRERLERAAALSALLADMGYLVLSVRPDGVRECPKIVPERHADLSLTGYLGVPEEDRAVALAWAGSSPRS